MIVSTRGRRYSDTCCRSYSAFGERSFGDDTVNCPNGMTPDINGVCCPIASMNSDGTCAEVGVGTAGISFDPSTPSITSGTPSAQSVPQGSGSSTGFLSTLASIFTSVSNVVAKPAGPAGGGAAANAALLKQQQAQAAKTKTTMWVVGGGAVAVAAAAFLYTKGKRGRGGRR